MIYKHIVFVLTLTSYQHITSLDSSITTNQPAQGLNITVTCHNHNNQNQLAQQESNLDANQKIDPIDWQKELYNIYQEQLNVIKNSSQKASDWIKINKTITIALACSAFYGYLFYQIYTTNEILNHQNAWCNWNSNRTLEDLFAIPQKQLASEILFTIQNRYLHKENPTDFIYSIVQALQSIQEEATLLQQQITRYQYIRQCYCNNIFFIHQQELADLQEKQRKLSFIKHILTSWCASYKIDKNKI